jgi:transglutaminase-like putative cysteine protease
MRLHIEHETIFSYTQPVREAICEAWLPRATMLGSTDISTTPDVVLAGRRGVCQDFAHLLIALCRSLGLPARYVSGYLHNTHKPADAILASRAWTEVFLGGRGWLGLDPTHNRATGALYTRVAIGRDYADAAPVRGIYQGDAKETLEVRVRMRAAEQEPLTR